MVNLVKRRIKGQKYYYLEHSYREGKKVEKIQKYIGKEIPKNINQIFEEFQKKAFNNVYQKLSSIKKSFQIEWKSLPASIKEKELQEIAIAFTYNTNAIEGSTITLEETREIIQDKISPNKSLRDVKETEAHSRIFLEMLNKKENLSEGLILRWHKDIFSGTKPDIAGEYREYLVRVGNHRAPDWQDIPSLMKNFIKFLYEKDLNPVEFSARAHYKFEKIHPFGDGNGRIGRLIMNYILWFNGYPMLIIEYKKRKSYYRALNRDENGFVNYFLRRYLSVHKSRIS